MTGSFANFMKDSENRKAQQNPNGEIHKNYVHAHHNQMAKNKIQRKKTEKGNASHKNNLKDWNFSSETLESKRV